METRAIAKHVRISPRKAGLVARSVAKLSPQQALLKLDSINQKGARILKDVIKSALANAQAKRIPESSLRFKSIDVSKGTFMKRFRAVSRGMAHTYKKKTSHITVIMEQKAG